MNVFKGTYFCQVKLVQAMELDLAVALEQVVLELEIKHKHGATVVWQQFGFGL
jgi:hypothetical protein